MTEKIGDLTDILTEYQVNDGISKVRWFIS